jgi:chromosomal replication initiation ATPase DnaA
VSAPSMASIVADVAAERGVPISVLMGRSRYKQDVRARQEAMWRCREVRADDGRHRYALQQIGQFFKRHHTTIIHACKRHLERTT